MEAQQLRQIVSSLIVCIPNEHWVTKRRGGHVRQKAEGQGRKCKHGQEHLPAVNCIEG